MSPICCGDGTKLSGTQINFVAVIVADVFVLSEALGRRSINGTFHGGGKGIVYRSERASK